MKKLILFLICACLLAVPAFAEAAQETQILLSGDEISVDGAPIGEDSAQKVYLDHRIETHEDVPEELAELENRVVTITAAGSYRISGAAEDVQIAVRAGEDDAVRLILDGVNISCRTAPAIAVYSAHDPRVPGEYGVTIELAEGAQNSVSGSHTRKLSEDDVKLDGAIDSLVSLGFEGSGSLHVDADNEGIEVKSGHLTINGGSFRIEASDDPLNVSEDGVGVLTVNDGYLFSSVKNLEGGEGDGIDSNGYIVFNGGVAINLAHPSSMDSGIDSDMGSIINGGVIVGAGNMYDPIDENSAQLFMMLEFAEATDDLVVVTDANDVPVFAYDFPYDYMYIAFSTPELQEGDYHVYLGGEIEGEQTDGLYTSITSYTPGKPLQHGEGNAQRGMRGGAAPDMADMEGMGERGERPDDFAGRMQLPEGVDLNEILKGRDLDELLKDKDLNGLISGFALSDLFTEEEIQQYFGDLELNPPMNGADAPEPPEGMGEPREMESSADVATAVFHLSAASTGFTNVRSAE